MSYTLEQLNAADEFSALVRQLETAVAGLQRLLTQAEAWRARVFVLPRVRREDEEKPVSLVETKMVEGREAFAQGLGAFNDWYGIKEYSTKAVHRLPGVLAYQVEDPQAIVVAVDHCNDLKRALKTVIPRLGNRDDRFELIHARHHMLILLQLTRQITALACPPGIRSVTFTWGFKTEIFKLTLDQACKVLEGYRKRPVPNSEPGFSWGERVDQEIFKLRSLPLDTELRHRRPLKIRPLVNVRYLLNEEEQREREQALARGESVNQPVKLYEGHTPLIVLNPPPGMSIGVLGTFCAETRSRRAPRKGLKTAAHPITGIGSIYMVKKAATEDD